jgi:methylenetetrahydrofolate dehydrogenase (NAD+)
MTFDLQDQYLQNVVDVSKDVEGLHHKYVYNMYHNIRFLDKEQTKKCIIPCTPLGIVKVMEFVGVYNSILPYGNRLHGRVVTIINRSEIVGRPLAALLANDGAKVFSVDINGIQEFDRGAGIKLKKHEVICPLLTHRITLIILFHLSTHTFELALTTMQSSFFLMNDTAGQRVNTET